MNPEEMDPATLPPGAAPPPGLAQDPGMMMAAEDPAMQGAPPAGPGAVPADMFGLPQGMQLPSTDPQAIASILMEMRARDMDEMGQRHQAEMMDFMAKADMAAEMAMAAIREMVQGAGATATDPAAGFQSGFGQPPNELIA